MNRRAPELDMVQIARRVARENGFEPEIPYGIEGTVPQSDPTDGVRDLRDLPWSSIDNAESRDLDQVEVAERLSDGAIRVLVGIADVDALAPRDSPIDRHAGTNTTTLYTGVAIFPMLPELLSANRTSLLEGRERLAVVSELVVRTDGSLDAQALQVQPARVHNQAKLVYERVGAWLEGRGSVFEDEAIAEQLRLQDDAARRLRRRRQELGALDFDPVEARPVTQGGRVVDLAVARRSRARELVEDLMIAANGATARFLERAGFSSIRRVLRAPKRWDRIVDLARSFGFALPAEPAAPALAAFLAERRAADPLRFADLSLSIVKLLGSGEYVVQRANEADPGHFGLAVEDYTHSTAPNRRYADLVTQRLVKAAVEGRSPPYSDDELVALAAHCTARASAARKVERTLQKVAAAALLAPRIGDVFDAIVTGVAAKGTFAPLLHPPAEGRVVSGERGLDVGDAIRVKLVDTEPARGFIDFAAL